MRKILYRAKAINRGKGYHRTKYKNGDWVYGLITRLYDERFETLPAEMTNTNGISGIEIDYKTIGQYTGLTDKNGKKIFEGDIVKADNGNIGYIAFDKGCFVKVCKCENRDYFLPLYSDNMEIIGNIYDNPELLEG